jgi:hypothetical protein
MDRVPPLNVLLGCFFLLLTALAHARFDSGSITGLVKDASMAVVPGAKITPINPKTGINVITQSNDAGVYGFPTVRVGSFKIEAEKAGFSLAAADDVTVSVATHTRVGLNLAVGRVSQTVEVGGGAQLVETEASQRGQEAKMEILVHTYKSDYVLEMRLRG